LKYGLDLLNKSRPIVGDCKESVSRTWSITFSQVERQSPPSADLLRFSAHLDPGSVPVNLIIEGREHLGPRLSVALVGVEHEPLILDTLLQTPASYSLLRRDTGSGLYFIHRMVKEALRGGMDKEESRTWCERVVMALSAAFPDVEYRNWVSCELLLPHALCAWRWINQWGFESSQAARLLNRIGSYYNERGRYDTAEPPLRLALDMNKKMLGADHPEVAHCLGSLAMLSHNQRGYERAESLYLQTLRILERARGCDDPEVAQSSNNLAQLYHEQGRYDEAERLYKRAEGIWRKARAPDNPAVATAINNLAGLYRVQGRYEDAASLSLRALAIRESALGPDHPAVAQTLEILAGLYFDTGNRKEARQLLERALGILGKAFGPNHPSTVSCRNDLDELLRQLAKASSLDTESP
jgi:tetratricopeptide (TPR) repeat protein